ncbi:MAG: DUF6265 family protein [Hyphomonadaceae bacterium]
MRVLVLSALLTLSACGATAQNPERSMPEWMSGYWLACDGGETAETWIGAGRDTLVGANLSDGGYEFLRIATNESGQIAYYSMPGGRSPPTEFILTGHANQRAVFENPTHDFPKRIIYERDGDVLTARIDGGGESGHAIEWRFQRAELDTRCPS